jgi:hypothetical protein
MNAGSNLKVSETLRFNMTEHLAFTLDGMECREIATLEFIDRMQASTLAHFRAVAGQNPCPFTSQPPALAFFPSERRTSRMVKKQRGVLSVFGYRYALALHSPGGWPGTILVHRHLNDLIWEKAP